MNINAMLKLWRNYLFLVPGFIILTCGAGCASNESTKITDDIESLKTQVWNLQKQTAELGLKISYTSEDVAQLSERVSNMEGDHPQKGSGRDSLRPRNGSPKESAQGAAGDGELMAQAVVTSGEAPPETWFKDLSAEEMYKQSLIIFNKGDYSGAVAGFNYLIKRAPESSLAPLAQFWIGESYYSQKRFAKAIEEYRKGITRFPGNPKIPDAMLKIGMSKLAMDLNSEGEEILKEVAVKYPDSAAAATANKILEEAQGAQPPAEENKTGATQK
ncbi:MAG: tol-pal system protein YbgF [Nitrospinae bacterium]|nr:tol-pal system protein YbgF [Nitrospinota bacterium]